MPSVHRELDDDQVVLRYDAMNDSRWTIEVAAKSLHSLPETVTTLRTCSVLDEVFGDQL